MKLAILSILACFIVAMVQAQTPTAAPACGDPNMSFAVHFAKARTAPQVPARGDRLAKLYVIEQYIPYDKGHFGQPIIRQGIDGKWVGATQGLSYLEADVTPGVHHLCSRWQSHNHKLSSLISLNSVNADVDHANFFLAQTRNDGDFLTLQSLSEDEGKRLLSQAPKAFSQPR